MWISNPMPDTTRIMTDDNGSSRSENGTVRSPDAIHVNTGWLTTRDAASSRRSPQTIASDTANAPAIAAQATAPAAALLIRRPKLAFSRNPTNGRSGIRRSIKRNHEDTKRAPSFSPFQLGEHVGVERLPVTEERDDDRQAHGRLGGGDGHDEEHDDLAVRQPHRSSE